MVIIGKMILTLNRLPLCTDNYLLELYHHLREENFTSVTFSSKDQISIAYSRYVYTIQKTLVARCSDFAEAICLRDGFKNLATYFPGISGSYKEIAKNMRTVIFFDLAIQLGSD